MNLEPRSIRWRVLVSLLALCAIGAGPDRAAADGDSMEDCALRNVPDKSSRQKVEFNSRDRMGNERTIVGTVSWKRFDDGKSKVMLRVHEPGDLKGAGLLMIEKTDKSDMFIYMPDLKKVKRVTSHMLSGSLFGSDFTYEDFMQLQGLSVEGRTEELEAKKLDGLDVRVIAKYPAESAGSAYERIVSFWDAESCVPLRTEMYETGEKLRKVLTVDRAALFRHEDMVLPQRLEMSDVRDETSTRLSLDEIQIDVDISRKIFSKSGLEQERTF